MLGLPAAQQPLMKEHRRFGMIIDNLDLWTGGPAMSASQDTGDRLKQQGHREIPLLLRVGEALSMGDGGSFYLLLTITSMQMYLKHIFESKISKLS